MLEYLNAQNYGLKCCAVIDVWLQKLYYATKNDAGIYKIMTHEIMMKLYKILQTTHMYVPTFYVISNIFIQYKPFHNIHYFYIDVISRDSRPEI